MHAYQVSMLGLVLDIFGAFFLAVEAIKLQNLEKLRERFLIPFHFHLRPRPITFVDDDAELGKPVAGEVAVVDDVEHAPAHEGAPDSGEPRKRFVPSATPGRRQVSFTESLIIWFFWHFTGGALLTALVLHLLQVATGFDLIAYLWAARIYVPALVRLPVTIVLALWFAGLVAAGPGEAMHKAVIWLSALAVNFLFWIDRRTPDGTIGILGFSLLLLGFAGQLLGTWLGRPTTH